MNEEKKYTHIIYDDTKINLDSFDDVDFKNTVDLKAYPCIAIITFYPIYVNNEKKEWFIFLNEKKAKDLGLTILHSGCGTAGTHEDQLKLEEEFDKYDIVIIDDKYGYSFRFKNINAKQFIKDELELAKKLYHEAKRYINENKYVKDLNYIMENVNVE